MFRLTTIFLAALAATVLLSPNPPPSALASSSPGDTVADHVLGQADFTSGGGCLAGDVSATTLCQPAGIALDAAGRLYVADSDNSRVLEYDTPLTGSSIATRVFGQPDFTSRGCNGVVGADISANSLCYPWGVALDAAGHLYVADRLNSRVLEYDDPLTSPTADRVIGQPNFGSRLCNQNAGPTASRLCDPLGVTLDSAGRLYVADDGNHRLLEYDNPNSSPVANRVFGQPGFTTALCNSGGISANSLCHPESAALNAAGNLFVADTDNHRVLEYDNPMSSASADRVFGEPDFTTNICNDTTNTTLCAPTGVALDAPGHLYVADAGPSRIMEYETPLTSGVASRVFGHASFTAGAGCNDGGRGASTLCSPIGVVVDGGGNLYVADFGNDNNRVLEYDSCLGTFGQPDNDVRGGSFGGTVPPAPPWIYDFVSVEGTTAAPDACDSNDDNSGCSDLAEAGSNHTLGGQRDPLNPWDFADMWTPALPLAGSRNGAISLQDVLSDLTWVGTSPGGAPNANGRQYDTDSNSNGVKDGVEYDRTASAVGGQPWRTGPPNGAVTLQDVLVVLASVGDHC